MTDQAERTDIVPIGAIATAPVPAIPLERPDPNTNPLTGKDERFGQELGLIGKFVGGGREKAGNIALIVVVASLLIIVGLIIGISFTTNADARTALDRMVSGFVALLTGSLGYLFGSGKKD